MQREGNTQGSASPTADISAVVAAAHELKSPLVLIRQLAFAAADGERSEHERDQALTQLTAVADRSLRLTTDLTRAARLEDSLFEVEPVNAQQLCEMIVAQIAPLYAEYGRTIYTTSHRSRPLVLAHRELLSSVLYHFADNALHYGHADSSVTM
jgi:signal transduction histidine kinase